MDLELEIMERNNSSKIVQYFSFMMLSVLDLCIVYFCCNVSIGSYENQLEIFCNAPLKMIIERFLFSLVISFCISALCLIVIYLIINIICFLFIYLFRFERKEFMFLDKSRIINIINCQLIIISFEVIVILCHKYYICGYI